MNKGTRGGVERLRSGPIDEATSVVVQIVQVEKNAKGKWVGQVNDGTSRCQAGFASQLLPECEDGTFESNAIVRMLSTVPTNVGGTNYIIVSRMTLVEKGSSVGMELGAPPPPVTQSTSPRAIPKTPGATTTSSVPRVTTNATQPTTTKRTPAARGPVTRTDDASVRATPIGQLNPYQNRWTMKARLVSKGDITTWSNAKGQGQLCKLTFADAAGDEIEAIMFRDAVTKWHAYLDEGAVYYVSNGRVKVANKQFSSTSSAYELMLDNNSRIILAPEDENIAKVDASSYKAINDVRDVAEGETCDVIGVLKGFDDMREVTSQKLNGRTLHKRELHFVDEGLVEIRVTVWGDAAKKEPPSVGSILALKGAKVSDFNGKSLSALRSSRMLDVTYDDDPRASALRSWWTSDGHNAATTTFNTSGGGGGAVMSPEAQSAQFYASGPRGSGGAAITQEALAAIVNERKTCDDLKTNGDIGRGTNYFTLKATVNNIKTEKLWYAACPTCSKKVTEEANGDFNCEKCGTTMAECTYRYLLQMAVADDTNSAWVSAFNETAGIILDATAKDLAELKDEDETAFDDKIDIAKFNQLLLRCRAKYETWNDVSRLKTNVVAVSPINFVKESSALLAAIASL